MTRHHPCQVGRGSLLRPFCVFLLSCLLNPVAAPGSEAQDGEAELDHGKRAAFLYSLATFVGWPQTAFADEQAPFVIGVIGDDSFGCLLEASVAHEYVGRRRITVRRFGRDDDFAECHLLFVRESERSDVRALARHLGHRPVLTVGETAEFVERGGMVAIDGEGERLVLVVSVAAMRRAGLSASSKLLEIAKAVNSGEVDS